MGFSTATMVIRERKTFWAYLFNFSSMIGWGWGINQCVGKVMINMRSWVDGVEQKPNTITLICKEVNDGYGGVSRVDYMSKHMKPTKEADI